jgi:hypothetical protein
VITAKTSKVARPQEALRRAVRKQKQNQNRTDEITDCDRATELAFENDAVVARESGFLGERVASNDPITFTCVTVSNAYRDKSEGHSQASSRVGTS